ncbi:MAG: glycosyltransferase [Muribaculaceae bacterium]|nr:glycosyltransferase [Muribaculaceae bacterium]
MSDNPSPLVSVIIPVYNVEKYLGECVDSILAQTYPNIEIILVDDGCKDASGKICDEYAAMHPEKIRVIHKTNGGVSSARNAGIEIAKGNFIGFIDSDDTIKPEMYAEMVEASFSNNAPIVVSGFLPWNVNSETSPEKNKAKIEGFVGSGAQVACRCLDYKLNISACTRLFSRSAIGDTRFRDIRHNEDLTFILEVHLKNHKVCVLPKAYYYYRPVLDSASHSFKDSFFDIFANLDYLNSIIPQDAPEVRKSFERYKLYTHIFSALRIVRFRKNKQYKKWLRKNRRYILSRWVDLLFDPEISLRWRVKAAAGFIHLP